MKDSTVVLGQEVKYQLHVIDSTSFSIASNGTTLIYRNLDRRWKSDFAKTLAELRAGDALYRRVTGWWKLRQASWRPVKLVNYPDEVNDFTLLLGRDGIARFYVENDPDSAIEYSWEPADSAIGLRSWVHRWSTGTHLYDTREPHGHEHGRATLGHLVL
ncbi:MAG: hypothetical protein IPF41_09555 [Flavobacteriales bacterium]|nr:hypothetical protein [Flavobacteriales bacterium]